MIDDVNLQKHNQRHEQRMVAAMRTGFNVTIHPSVDHNEICTCTECTFSFGRSCSPGSDSLHHQPPAFSDEQEAFSVLNNSRV